MSSQELMLLAGAGGIAVIRLPLATLFEALVADIDAEPETQRIEPRPPRDWTLRLKVIVSAARKRAPPQPQSPAWRPAVALGSTATRMRRMTPADRARSAPAARQLRARVARSAPPMAGRACWWITNRAMRERQGT